MSTVGIRRFELLLICAAWSTEASTAGIRRLACLGSAGWQPFLPALVVVCQPHWPVDNMSGSFSDRDGFFQIWPSVVVEREDDSGSGVAFASSLCLF